jgi:hypothetical protein
VIISVINRTNGQLRDKDVQSALRAVNRQIAEDFQPYWNMGGTLRLEGKGDVRRDPDEPADMRGDAVLYLWDKVDVDNALGYHDRNHRGVPFGVIFLEIIEQVGEPWSVTLSHEALELIADPEVNLLVKGPHPADSTREVFHWFEMCDAVQDERYEIDGLGVSNFVLPMYFSSDEEQRGRNDFLGRSHSGATLRSFGVAQGGYIGFYDPATRSSDTYSGDARGEARRRIKLAAGAARRAVRYQLPPAAVARAAGTCRRLGRSSRRSRSSRAPTGRPRRAPKRSWPGYWGLGGVSSASARRLVISA